MSLPGYDHREWYDSVYPSLTSLGLWLRGGEINTLPPEEYDKRPFRVLFARLSTYSDVASSFTHSYLYQLASGLSGCFPDISYLPPGNDLKIFERDNVPLLLGTQTKFGPAAFDLIGFSNSIVQEMLNIPIVLRKSGIPVRKSERLDRDDIPIVILGGANAIHSTAIWGKDPLVDGVFVGDDPASIKDLLNVCAEARSKGGSKSSILSEMTKVQGFILPDAPARTIKKNFSCVSGVEPFTKGIVPYSVDEMGAGHLQISEGCKASCSFCSESWTRKPYSEFSNDTLIKNAERLKSEMGLEKINIFSFNFNMYSGFYGLVLGLIPRFSQIGLKSQRFDMLAFEPGLVECQSAIGKTTFSCGLEGISARLRKYLNKNLDEGALRTSFTQVFDAKGRELKVFLLATGKEEEEDFEDLGRLLDYISRQKKRSDAGTRIVFSLTPLVRFPWTPLEFEDAPLPEKYKQINERIKLCVESFRFEFREAMGGSEYLVSQILARASDERITDAVVNASRDTNFVYYRGIPHPFLPSFIKNIEDSGLNVIDLLKGFSLKESELKPWVVMDTGINRKALWEIYHKNSGFEEAGSDLTEREAKWTCPDTSIFAKRVSIARNSERAMSFDVIAGRSVRGVPRKYLGLVLARAIMKADPRLIPYFRSFAVSFWAGDGLGPGGVIGSDVITLLWNGKACPVIEQDVADPGFMLRVNDEMVRWGSFMGLASTEKPVFKLWFDSPLSFDGDKFLKKQGLKYTLFKDKDGTSVFAFTKDSVKKNVMSDLRVKVKNPGALLSGSEVRVTAGPKFDADAFLKEAFTSGERNDWVRIEVSAKRVVKKEAI
jgi:radical SAM superfamily enzyme YgiQ (UPF0313 family)